MIKSHIPGSVWGLARVTGSGSVIWSLSLSQKSGQDISPDHDDKGPTVLW